MRCNSRRICFWSGIFTIYYALRESSPRHRAHRQQQEDIRLSSYLQVTPITASPLQYLPPSARQRFFSSLAFGENGLRAINDPTALNGLTPTQAYQILSLFGLQSTVPLIGGLQSSTPLDALIMSNTASAPAACHFFERLVGQEGQCTYGGIICCGF